MVNATVCPLDEADIKIICALQRDLPLVSAPYKQMAEDIGITEDEFLRRMQRLLDKGIIRKMGAVLRHREVGYVANVLCVWEVAEEKLAKIARRMSRHPAVSHCYDRYTAPGWPYNLYTMIHAKSRNECEKIAAELERECGVTNRVMLYTRKEWKKTSMKYFCED